MDKLYIGDIPQSYHYARFNNGYVDLYNSSYIAPNTSFTYYRVYMYDNYFAYDVYTGTTGYNGSTISQNIEVTDNIMYRRDMPSIICMTFIFALCFVLLINIVTSVFRKGGVLGGLL